MKNLKDNTKLFKDLKNVFKEKDDKKDEKTKILKKSKKND